MFIKKDFTRLILILFVCFSSCKTDAETQPVEDRNPSNAMRGVWVTNVDSKVLYTKKGILDCVALCKKSGINTIFMVVWNKGYTLFPSKVMYDTFGVEIDPDLSGRDPLKEMVEAAHAENIKVYAWFEYGFAADYNGVGGHILKTKPNWAAQNSLGQTVNKNGFNWLNSLDPEVQKFMKDMILETVKNYDIDGIQGDDRLPAMPIEGGYNPKTLAAYLATNNNQRPLSDTDTNWKKWRIEGLNLFMKDLYLSTKALKPAMLVSMGPSIYPFAEEQYLQNWPTWVANGWVDSVCPQIYRYDITKYKAELAKITSGQVTSDKLAKLSPGILLKVGTYTPTLEFLKAMVEANRAAGLKGEIFFFYEGLKAHPAYFDAEYK
jgi:uncharacterized lipoprotein YddW (UPF0748 family)